MTHRAHRGLWVRLTGRLLLALLVVVQCRMLPLATAMLADLEGGHGVEVVAGRDGVQVVLRHSGVGARHCHGGCLKLIAGEDGPGHADHLFVFSHPGGPAEKSGGGELQEMDADMDALHGVPAVCGAAQKWAVAGGVLPLWWPPAPADAAWGSTVYLL